MLTDLTKANEAGSERMRRLTQQLQVSVHLPGHPPSVAPHAPPLAAHLQLLLH